MAILNSLSRPQAITRLKINLFLLFLYLAATSVFTPYLTIRRSIIRLGDELQVRRGGERSYALSGISAVETLILLTALWNIFDATMALRYPQPIPLPATGMVFTPNKVSSPTTRAYPSPTATPTRLTSTSTPSRFATTPKGAGAGARASPLSSSTAKLLNIKNESPLKQSHNAQSGAIIPQGLGTGPGPGPGPGPGDFVMVEREEKEWVDNVWKGIRGKGGRVGL